jgi:cytoskeletal protein CcmA (bactofilin family)
MRKEYGQIEGDVTLGDALALYGLCAGDITVQRGGVLHLYGMCAGDVKVEAGASAVIYGMCTGDIVNSGGQVEVRGMVMGYIQKLDGTTTVLPGAKVRVVE